jgi:hypothetical protein
MPACCILSKNKHMSQPIRLSIPKPCHEKWDDFAPTSTGGFCSSCSKSVVDFTKMTDAEVIEFIKTKPANACGRFRQGQLKDYTIARTYVLRIKPSGMFLKAGLISLLLAFINKPTSAQTVTQPVKTEQGLAEKLRPSGDGKRMITGIVLDNDSVPMPGVNVVLAGSGVGIVTDADGKFRFPQPLEDGQALIFSFIGYATYTHYVGFLKENYLQVRLNPDLVTVGKMAYVTMGELLTNDVPTEKKNLFATIKKWFR